MLKIESGNEALMDGHTDGRTDGRTDRQTDGRTLKRNFLNGGYNIIPALFKVAGIKRTESVISYPGHFGYFVITFIFI